MRTKIQNVSSASKTTGTSLAIQEQQKSKNKCTLTCFWFIDFNADTEPFYIALISADFMQHLLFDRYRCFHPIYNAVRVIRQGAALSLKNDSCSNIFPSTKDAIEEKKSPPPAPLGFRAKGKVRQK